MDCINWNIVGTFAALAFCGLLAAMLLRRPLKAACASFMAMPHFLKVALVSIAIVATVQAQKQQNGGDGTQGLPTPPLLSPRMLPQTVSDEEIAQGYRFAYETNDIAHNFTMPTNGAYAGNAHIHGAASSFGRNLVDFGGWSFHFGPSNTRYSSAWWFIDGRIRFAPHDAGREISTGVSGSVLAMQGRSRIWHGPCDGGYAICWENVFLGGDTNAATNLQIVMRDNGWFETWSNEVGRVYKSINPYDWDDDGLDNTIDSTPKAYDGNCFGTGIDWLNANCGAILSASLDADDAIRIDWNPNSSENAYYWLSFTATHDSTRITITCDGPSNLGDMVVIANEGQACSVPLLIGAVYRIRSDWPVDSMSTSDPAATIRLAEPMHLLRGGNAAPRGSGSDFDIERPLDFTMSDGESGGHISTVPDVGAAIESIVGSCCPVNLNGSNYVWNCTGCHCTGYWQSWQIGASWEGYRRFFWTTVQCPCQRSNEQNPDAWFSLSCPSVIIKGGNSHVVAGSFNPPCETNATMSLACIAGAEKIEVLDSGDDWQEIRGVAKSGSIGDVAFALTLEIGGETHCKTQTLTVAEVVRMDVTSPVQGASANPPPFMTGVDYPFSVTNSPLPDKHLVVPFCNVATLAEGGFEVADFSVSMNLVLEPEGVNASSLPCEWELIEALPQMSGSLSHVGALAAHFVNPRQGGVYRFRGRCDGSPWTHANIVLPLCGASIDAVFDADMAVVASAMQTLRDTKSWYQKQDGDFGDKWFYDHNVMDYIGRVDNTSWPTVWRYNQITDDVLNEYYRMGAVATFRGVPTPVAKLGNFMAGYGTETVGVWRILRWASQFTRGLANDATGSMSWAVGEDFATSAGTNLVECTTTLATNMWSLVAGGQVENDKVFALWPNPANTDNHADALTTDFDHNRQFLSPGIVRQTPPPQN